MSTQHTLFILSLLSFFTTHSETHVVTKKPTVAIVGAGLAGLTTAYRLHHQGYDVSVYKARSRPGGRTFTCYFDNGEYEELGGQNISDGGDAPHITALINELNLSIEEFPIGWDRTYLDSQNKPLPYIQLFKTGPQPTKEIYHALKQKADQDVPMSELLDEFLGTNTPLRAIAEKRTSGYEGCATHQLSSWYFDSFWEYYTALYHIATSHATLSTEFTFRTIKGGMCNLIQKLCKPLDHCIRYQMPLKKITYSTEQKPILVFENNTQVQADVIVLALPCSTLKHVFIEENIIAQDQQHMINTLQYGTNAKIILPIQNFTQPVLGYGNQATAFVCLKPVIWCYYGGECGIFDSSCEQDLKEKLAQEILHLNTIFPNRISNWHIQPLPTSTQAKVYAHGPVGISWAHEEFSRGSYSALAPGQLKEYEKRSTHYGEEVRTVFRPSKNIFFAGEHTSITIPSTMEGAVESGERTYRMVRNYIEKRPRPMRKK